MKITEISKEYLEKGGLIRRKTWDLNISIGLSTSKNDFIYYENSKPKKPTTFFRGLVQDIMADDWKVVKKSKKPKNKVWKPKKGDKYYYIGHAGSMFNCDCREDISDEAHIGIGNYFKTEEEAEHMKKKLQIIAKLKELSNIDFNTTQNLCYSIVYAKDDNRIMINFHHMIGELPFNIYFASKEDCQKAIDTIGEENLKKYYFEVVNDEKKN